MSTRKIVLILLIIISCHFDDELSKKNTKESNIYHIDLFKTLPISEYISYDVLGFKILLDPRCINSEYLCESIISSIEMDLRFIYSRVSLSNMMILSKTNIIVSIENKNCEHISVYYSNEDTINKDRHEKLEICSIDQYYREKLNFPFILFHELSHAFDNQMRQYLQEEKKKTFQNAKSMNLYKNVSKFGFINKKIENAYALKNESEYFAEISTAFFFVNHTFPYSINDLSRYDHNGYLFIKKAWDMPYDPPCMCAP